MGIRVKKMVGYGVTDLLVNRQMYTNFEGEVRESGCHDINDPRVDYSKFRDALERPGSDFATWVKSNKDLLMHIAEREHYGDSARMLVGFLQQDVEEFTKHWSTWDSVVWDGEFGIPNVMVFTVPGKDLGWSRRNNTLDFHEETHTHKQRVRVEVLRTSGIYPFEGWYVQARPATDPDLQRRLEEATSKPAGSPVPIAEGVYLPPAPTKKLAMSSAAFKMLLGEWSETLPPLTTDEALLEHLRNDWRPQVPLDILAFIHWMGCFPDPQGPTGICASLRPVLYVYWA